MSGGFDAGAYLSGMSDDEWKHLLRDLGDAASRFRRKTGNRLPEDVTDFVSGCVAKLLREPHKWQPERRRHRRPLSEELRAYLVRAIWCDILSFLESAGVRRREDYEDAIRACPEMAPSPEELMMKRDRANWIARMREFLRPYGYTPLFDLHFIEGCKPRESARLLRMPVERVYAHIQQIKVLLRRHFGDDGFLEDLLA
ncbi:MAG: hypothetical protein R3B81_08235 [bacterium]